MTKSKTGNTIGAISAFIFLKAGKLFYALKSLKYAKYLLTVITMAFSSLLYGFKYGSWVFGIGLVLMILVHETGHAVAMVKKGMKATVPIFIPFLGAAIFCEPTKDKDKEAYIGYGGPLLGTLGALACIAFAFLFEDGSHMSGMLHILGNVGLMINLFNLIPARPLDGGRILHVLGDSVAFIGLPILLLLAISTGDTVLIFIALVTASEANIIKFKTTVFLMGLCTSVGTFLVYAEPTSGSWDVLINAAEIVILAAMTVAFFVALIFSKRKDKTEIVEDVTEVQEKIAFGTKLKWVTYYLAITIGIVMLMVWHSQFLPKEVLEHSFVRAVS